MNRFFKKASVLMFFAQIFLGLQAHAITPTELIWPNQFVKKIEVPKIFRELGFRFDNTYRIGDEWGKKKVTADDLKGDVHYRRMAYATARVGGATGFFLGEFNGHFVMATNHHVCEDAQMCMGTTVRFPLLNMQFRITDFYGSWTDIDLALFEISPSAESEKTALKEVSSPFAFSSELYRGEELATLGFGVGDNPSRSLVGNRDSDCVVFSDRKEFRFMGDPDDLNPGPYKAWSFANGCDVSHGDSGSAMMDRKTGAVVGIIWTGKIPKSSKIQSSSFLSMLLQSPNEDVWEELSYAVPALKMQEVLTQLIQNGELKPAHAEIVSAMFGK